MERSEFLKLMGWSAGALVVVSCLEACKKDSSNAMKVDFTLDLSDAANSALATSGGYLVKQGVIVAKTTSGSYIAVASACTHEGIQITYQGSQNRFYCPGHGATFNNSGGVTNGPAKNDLQKFNTTLSGNNLRVYS
jgi:cytochrome b6-f complex iron-sulfur subunit